MEWLISLGVFLGLCALLNALLPHPPSRRRAADADPTPH